MFEPDATAGGGEALRAKGGAVVGEYAPQRHAEAGEVLRARSEKSDGRGLPFIGLHLRKPIRA
jgi:hypothetical protein